MKSKIFSIKDCDTCKEVIIQLIRNDTGKDLVQISCWHEKDNDLLFQTESIDFPTPLMAKRFITDYTEYSANEFANEFNF